MSDTRISLYKLFLRTTEWASVSRVEYLEILRWLYMRRSRSSRRNQFDSLYETFVWFPTEADGPVFVPLGHLTRARKAAMPKGYLPRGSTAPAVVVDWGYRTSIPGDQILEMRLAQINRGDR